MKIKLTKACFIPTFIVGTPKQLLMIIMRTFIFLFCTALFGFTPRHVSSQNDKIVIDEDKVVTVDEVFDILKTQTDYTFIYHEDLFKDFPKVQLKRGIIRANKLLEQILSASSLDIVVTKNNKILIKEKTSHIRFQQRSVSGTVTNQAGLPLPGATVLIKGTATGTDTNFDGSYTLTVPNPENVLVFSYLGFETQEITVGNQTTINVSFRESISALDEVTINAGYYKTSERERTGSIGKIDAKTIEKQPVSNPLAAMQGYIPGVNITQSTGLPGSGLDIEIRGKNFITGSTDPLYIVDGVPFSSELLMQRNNAVAFPRDGNSRGLSALNLINTSDIETIEVLKDADATAIYGSRGANGVVLITTKKGKAGKTKVNVNVSTSMGTVPFVDLLNTEQYLEMRLEGIVNEGYTLETLPENLIRTSPDLYVWDPNRYTDWQEVLIGGTAYRNNSQLSFSGGNEQTQFLFSGGYENSSTVYPGDSKYGKASVHSSINHQSVDKRLQVNTTISYVADDNNVPNFSTRFTTLAYTLPPNAPALYDENGDLNWENNTWQNPLAKLENDFRLQSKNLLMNSVISYRPISALEFKANLGYTDQRVYQYVTVVTASKNPAFLSNTLSANSTVNISNASSQTWIVEPQMNWQKDWGKASLNILMGATFEKRQSMQLVHTGIGFPSDSQILNLSAANVVLVDLDQETEYNYQSVFGRINFKWADRYIVNLTGRRDGSSRFGPGRQFGNFGAVGAAWLFSEEPFLKESTLLSFGKLRSSYGITGSDNIGNYNFYDSYETTGTSYNGSGLQPIRLFNPIFGWEENKKFEATVELGFLQDRVFLTTSWYRNISSNQLVGTPLPGTTGFSSVNANFEATVQNTGLEMDFRSENIQNNNFKWTTTFNLTVPKNKLVKFDGLETSTYKTQYAVGRPISISPGLYHNTGVDPNTGLYTFEDYNSDGVINSDDLQWREDTAPKYYGGLNNTINYKNWTLDVFFNFKRQRGPTFLSTVSFVPGQPTNQPVSVLNRWQQVGDEATIQRYSVGSNTLLSDTYSKYKNSNEKYTDASFTRLRNISLAYAIPKDLLRGIDVSIYLQGQNLLTFTKYQGADPEQLTQDGYLPLLRQFTMGLQIGF
ncbi:MAG TPA: SusC/RagA family TonB-linked outer membrane protein [Flavobacteriaceae bacterium]